MSEAKYSVRTMKQNGGGVVAESGPFTLPDAETEADRIAAIQGPAFYPAIVEIPDYRTIPLNEVSDNDPPEIQKANRLTNLILSIDLQEVENVKKEAADLINRLKDIVDDLERAAEHGAEGIATLFEGQFAVDHLDKGDNITVSAWDLKGALKYYRNN